MKGMTVFLAVLILALLVFVACILFIVTVRTDIIEPFKNILNDLFTLPI
jgi:hypothetical protein